MSRSYKKTPIMKDNLRGRKYFKRLANKTVRRTKNVGNGKDYRKVYNSWDIYDFVSHCTLDEYKRIRRKYNREILDDEELEQEWRRYYYNK